MNMVKFGVIGYGQRGYGMLDLLLSLDDVIVTAVCDKYDDRAESAKKRVVEKRGNVPFCTLNYMELLERNDVDAVLIATDWEMHVEMAINAMKAKKAVAVEVSGAYCLQDCFDLVDTWEKTKVPFMFLENCCYNREELLVMELAKRGVIVLTFDQAFMGESSGFPRHVSSPDIFSESFSAAVDF